MHAYVCTTMSQRGRVVDQGIRQMLDAGRHQATDSYTREPGYSFADQDCEVPVLKYDLTELSGGLAVVDTLCLAATRITVCLPTKAAAVCSVNACAKDLDNNGESSKGYICMGDAFAPAAVHLQWTWAA